MHSNDEMVRVDASAEEKIRVWLRSFETALADRDAATFDELFEKEAVWRDLIALTWDLRQRWSRETLREEMFRHSDAAELRDIEIDPERTAPNYLDVERSRIEVFFRFTLAHGNGRGLVQLRVQEDGGLRAIAIGTTLAALDGIPEPGAGVPHPRQGIDPIDPGETWGRRSVTKSDFTQRDPEVLIIGGGQAGVSLTARLERLGVASLVIDRHQRPGDSWRRRYGSLALHTPTPANNLPFLQLPKTHPNFMSKDQWADWIEAYVRAMDLNYWSSTEARSAVYNETKDEWDVELQLADGQTRTMHPKHVVIAMGGVGVRPIRPSLPGLDSFSGTVLHSSDLTDSTNFKDQRVMVVGTSTSGHDIALEAVNNGGSSWMLQRSSTTVVNITEAINFNADYTSGERSEQEIDERRNMNWIYPKVLEKVQTYAAEADQRHEEFYDDLRKAGLQVTSEDWTQNWAIKVFRDFSGYYLNVGASEAIIEGRIKVVQAVDLESFVPEGVRLNDGSVIELDAVVLATGFANLREEIAGLVGPDVANRVGDVGGMSPDDGELRNNCRPTAQAGLWFIQGGIMDVRRYCGLLALQLKANLDGTIPTLVRTADGDLAASKSDDGHPYPAVVGADAP
ncbi:NAD(P)/FAD-dependent oxidoreductase [Rhodococcus sp. WS4]|nr:NAD(P)/FAD-dependent oxidoreductase [Rhodococcus sp. WS4]